MEKLVKQIISRYFTGHTWQWPKNWVLKLFSFMFAFFLWYFVVGEDKVDMTVYVPMEIVNLPRDLVISNQFKRQLEVMVSGPRGLIRDISRKNIIRSVNLSSAQPGTVVIRNDINSITFPRGISVYRIQPSQITLLLDRLLERELQIKPVINGTPAEGYELTGVHLEPASINLTAPEAVLGAQKAIYTQVIDITAHHASSVQQVSLVLEPAIAELLGEPVVTARISIEEKIITKTISRIPIEFNHEGERTIFRITPGTVAVTAKLPYNMARDTKNLTSLFHPEIKAAGLASGSYELPVEVKGNGSVTIIDFVPKKVTLHISPPQPLMKIIPERKGRTGVGKVGASP